MAAVGRKEADRVVTPIVRQPARREMPVDDRLVYRQQLNRRDTEVEQILEHGLAAQTEVRASQLIRDVGVQARHSLYVALVDDRAIPRNAQRLVVLPGERRTAHEAFRHAALTG